MKRIFIHDGEKVVEVTGTPEKSVARFEPHYDPALRSFVTSWADKERKMKNHRSSSHPEGLKFVEESFLKECEDIRKNRIDYMRQTYGENYVKHQMETNKAFRDKVNGSRRVFVGGLSGISG